MKLMKRILYRNQRQKANKIKFLFFLLFIGIYFVYKSFYEINIVPDVSDSNEILLKEQRITDIPQHFILNKNLKNNSTDNFISLTSDKYIICIYSSYEDLKLAKELQDKLRLSFNSGIYIPYLSNSTMISLDAEILIVLTFKPHHYETSKEQYLFDKDNNILYLNVKESYIHLSLKTYHMINAIVDLYYDFDYLLKWDAGTYDLNRCTASKSCWNWIYDQFINNFIATSYHLKYNFDYWGCMNGFIDEEFHIVNIDWFKTKGKYQQIINDNRDMTMTFESYMEQDQQGNKKKILYRLGKFYILSHKFASYISNKKYSLFLNIHNHGGSSEDIAVGLSYVDYLKSSASIHNDDDNDDINSYHHEYYLNNLKQIFQYPQGYFNNDQHFISDENQYTQDIILIGDIGTHVYNEETTLLLFPHFIKHYYHQLGIKKFILHLHNELLDKLNYIIDFFNTNEIKKYIEIIFIPVTNYQYTQLQMRDCKISHELVNNSTAHLYNHQACNKSNQKEFYVHFGYYKMI